jgi:geranylgeranyl reductase family protein
MTDSTNPYDVLIIGAGPTGSRIAYKLADIGHSVCVLERGENLESPVCCTGLVSRECVEKYSIPDDLIYRWVNSATFYSPSGKSLRVQRDSPQVAVLNRPAFNKTYAERAQKAGAEFLFDCDVRDIEHGKSQAKVSYKYRGETVNLQSRAVVVTTGFGSHLVGELGLGCAGDFVIGAQAEVEVQDVDEVEVYFGNEIAPSFFAWLVPASEGKALVGLLSRRNAPFYLKKLLTSLVTEGKITSTDFKLTSRGVPLQPLPYTHNNNLMVVGTAAGQVKPTTGGGIYYGLMCADIAADTMHHALLIDNVSDTILAGYESGWRKKLGRELTVGYWARKVYETLNDGQVDRLFGLLDSTGMIEELCSAEELSFDWQADAIKKVVGRKLFAIALGSVKTPFQNIKRAVSKKKI